MTRIKTGTTRRNRHKKVLKLTAGHKGSRHRLFKQANESMLHALSYSYALRKEKKGDLRRLWNIRINAAARENGISYSKLIHGLKVAGIKLDRKVLSEIAASDPQTFSGIVEKAKLSLQN